MNLRAPFVLIAVLLGLAACAGAQRQERLREQLDEYNIPKPLAEVWPEALRYVNERGFDLVGKDRLVLGDTEQGSIGKFFSKGHETQAVSEHRWVAETAANAQQQRYRVVGIRTGPSRCRVEYYSVTSGDPIRGGELSDPDREFRDVHFEIELIERFDPDRAEKMLAAAKGEKR